MDLEKIVQGLLADSARVRGTIINNAILIERLMDDYLTRYFCADQTKKIELAGLIMCERVSFDYKRQAFEYILEKYHKKYYEENVSKIRLLTSIMKVRNVLAHQMIDTSISGIEGIRKGEMTFIKFLKDPAKTVYTQEKLNGVIRDIGILLPMLQELNNGETSP